jgi:K+/H+ antiporter YhaU regulatory subunit KhtT
MKNFKEYAEESVNESATNYKKLGDIMNKMVDLDAQMKKIASKEDWMKIEGDEDFFKYYDKVRDIVDKEIPDFKWI